MNRKNRRVFIDSGVWISAFNKKDIYHDSGAQIVNAIFEGKFDSTIITDYIFNEVVTYSKKKLGPKVANEIAEKILQSNFIEIIQTDTATFNASYHIFCQYPNLSFTDASIVVTMLNNNIKFLFSYDGGFDGIEKITRLNELTEII